MRDPASFAALGIPLVGRCVSNFLPRRHRLGLVLIAAAACGSAHASATPAPCRACSPADHQHAIAELVWPRLPTQPTVLNWQYGPLTGHLLTPEPPAQPAPSAAAAATLPPALAADHPLAPASPYLDSVRRWAREFELPEALLLAVIHTESRFDPAARSGANALGLMQLIPEYAGADAWAFLTGEKRVPTESELLDPDTNIRLGAAYLRMLKDHYWSHVEDPTLLQALVLASYNWGVGNVLRRVKTPANLAALEAALERSAPSETARYLRRVRERARDYEALLLTATQEVASQE